MSQNDFIERLKVNPRPVVVDFWAPWCVPCRASEPVMKKLAADYAGRVDVWKVNADEQAVLLRSLGIYSIPTLVAFHDGNEIGRRTGMVSVAALSTLFDASLTGEKPAKTEPAPVDRLVRLSVGVALIGLAFIGGFHGIFLVLAGLGVGFLFTAFYDRCPIYMMVSSRVKSWFQKEPGNSTLP